MLHISHCLRFSMGIIIWPLGDCSRTQISYTMEWYFIRVKNRTVMWYEWVEYQSRESNDGWGKQRRHTSSGKLEPAHSGSQELVLHISSQGHVQRYPLVAWNQPQEEHLHYKNQHHKSAFVYLLREPIYQDTTARKVFIQWKTQPSKHYLHYSHFSSRHLWVHLLSHFLSTSPSGLVSVPQMSHSISSFGTVILLFLLSERL